MEPLNIAELKAHLSEVLAQVNQTGEPVTIAKYGKPIAKIIPFTDGCEERKLGFASHLTKAPLSVLQSQVDAPTDTSTLDEFYN